MRHRSWVKIAFVYSEDKVDIPEDVQHLLIYSDTLQPKASAFIRISDRQLLLFVFGKYFVLLLFRFIIVNAPFSMCALFICMNAV